MVKYTRMLAILVLCCLVSACALLSHPEQTALKEAYIQANQIVLEAELTGDTSLLIEVFPEEKAQIMAKEIQEEFEQGKTKSLFEEIEVDWVKVIEYNPPEAIIEVKYFYRVFSYNRETGKRIYSTEPHRYWRIWKKKMIQENNVWKSDETLEFVDWSG